MIRKANLEDLDELIKLYRASIKKMISKKISQWDHEYPNKEVLKKDILAQNYYVFFDLCHNNHLKYLFHNWWCNN